MKRRQFLAASVAGGAAIATGLAAPAIAQTQHRWRMVTAWPRDFPAFGTSAARLAQRIEAMSDGRLVVEVFPAGELVAALECFDAVVGGAAEAFHATPYWWQDRNPAFNFLTSMPFGLTAVEHHAWLRWGGGQELWDELYGRFGLKGFPAGDTGTQAAGWFRQEIGSPADLAGLRFRTAGLNAEIMRRLGAEVVTLAGADAAAAFRDGTIDAVEWVGPYHDLALGFQDVAKNYYSPSLTEPSGLVEFTVATAAFDALPADLQAIVAAATEAESIAMATEFAARNGAALKTLVEDHGVILRPLPESVVLAIAEAKRAVVAELTAANEDAARLEASYAAFLATAAPWTGVAERGFLDVRALGI